MGKDHTIFAKIAGIVEFVKTSHKNRIFINVVAE